MGPPAAEQVTLGLAGEAGPLNSDGGAAGMHLEPELRRGLQDQLARLIAEGGVHGEVAHTRQTLGGAVKERLLSLVSSEKVTVGIFPL